MLRKARRSTCATVALVTALFCFTPGLVIAEQSLGDIPAAIDGLLKSPAEDAFLVINIAGTEDFVQLGGYRGTAFLDFPQITERQQALRDEIETVCADLGLVLEINVASNGAEFLDYELSGSAGEMTAVVQQVLIRVYGVDPGTALEFDTNGF